MNNLCDGFELRFLNYMAHCTDDFAERLVSLMLKHKTLSFVLKPKEYFCKNGKTHTPDELVHCLKEDFDLIKNLCTWEECYGQKVHQSFMPVTTWSVDLTV